MAAPDTACGNPAELLSEWLERLSSLANLVKGWAEELDWSTRLIQKKMKDSYLGKYEAPALLMQKETTRVLLDPIARFSPGTEGVVDLYLMPAYDDIASLVFVKGKWWIGYSLPGPDRLLSKEALTHVLEVMSKHASESL